MLVSQDLHGLLAMMPAFATRDATNIRATDTVDVGNLRTAVDRIITDGANVIATSGSFGEFHTLLWEEFVTLTHAAVEAVGKRVPLFVGTTSLNTREAIQKMRVAQDAGADGVLLGLPFYFPSTVDNAIRFYQELGDMFPRLNIMIYHNPVLHRAPIPVSAFRALTENPRIIGMKDSHRDTKVFQDLQRVIKGKISVFVNALQYHPFAGLGAAGFWSYECWMGPWPLLRLRDLVDNGEIAAAQELMFEIMKLHEGTKGLEWRETAFKIAIAESDYCEPGPLRPPFLEIPKEVQERARERAAYWREICAKHRPFVEQRQLVTA